MTGRRFVAPFALLIASVLALPACGAPASPGTGPRVGGRLTVFAASSLTDAFAAVGKALERRHPGLQVRFNVTGTPTLVAQIRDGAPADVIAAAEEDALRSLHSEGVLREAPELFTSNHLTIIVQPGNPGGIHELADLARPGLLVALAAPDVPAGRLAREVFRRAGLTPPEASLEASARGVLAKVALGEVDAGVVFVTDARAGGDRVRSIAIPDSLRLVARYSIGIVREAPNPGGARAFVDAVTSTSGRRVLARFGFLPVTPGT
ncbi:MAG: molybdate ABC transporter substrate-binding protein [Actinomycetota bacterium]